MKIEWFPGHMTKAQRQIAEAIQGIDVIIEVLDARLPVSSANPLLEELRRNKPCIKVLNKNDLADPVVTKAWVRHFEKQAGVRALPLEARKRLEVGHIPPLCRRLAPHRGQPGKPLRAMVIGIPNVGKSTLINTLAGKTMARVGDRPAITTCPQQIDLRNGIRLSDTPGLLWPVLSDQQGAYRLATSGAIGESAMDYVQVALFAADYLLRRYPEQLRGRYKLVELPLESTSLLEEIGRRRGCLVSGGEVDLHRAAELFLRELRGGKLGRISLEEPGQEAGEDAVAEGSEDAPEGV
jgi:ribosome biogenesis GTPase A